jgi:hypothetical protein
MKIFQCTYRDIGSSGHCQALPLKYFQGMPLPMSAEEYRTILHQLGWTHAQAAAALGVTERTSFNYARRGAPTAVALALRALLGAG